jgi:arsenite methyltransferase
MPAILPSKPDYGVDAPAVMRNMFVIGIACLLMGLFGPRRLTFGSVTILPVSMFLWTGGFLIVEGFLFLIYVKVGKFRHRDKILAMHTWRGDEQVLDVGCGRGLLLAGAAKLVPDGHATGIDIWSNVDMGGNSIEATRHNLNLEGIADRTTLLSESAQQMSFPDNTFDVVVSNLCLHNIYDRPTRMRAVAEIVRVLKPGGQALLSDYKNTRQYAAQLRKMGLTVDRKYGNLLATFPPLAVVVARKS